ncbi:hypothetical protein CBW18_03720 [Pedobacter sp. AJM]|nr:hypothetical protein CBW18_03720 [Pedobacter sp. AJM]
MIKLNLYLVVIAVTGLGLFLACNANNDRQQKTSAVLDTVSLSSKSFALAYQDGSKIVATSIDTMKQISFGGATHPAISPDGNKLAYTVTDSAGNKSIWIADMESKSQLQLQADSKDYDHAMWSPDGRTIAFNFLDKQHIWKVGVIKADNTGFILLDSKPADSLFSPSWKNETELVAHDLKNLYTFNKTGKLTDTKKITDCFGPDYQFLSSSRFFYTSDGRKLIFNARYGKPVEELHHQAEAVFILEADSKKVSRISPEGMNALDVFVTADNRIFFSGAEKPFSQSKIYVSDLKGNIKTVVDKGTYPTATLK